MNPFAYTLTVFIKFYRFFVSPLIGSNCRFHPTCSTYSLEAIQVHGVFYGSWLTLGRIMRCNPLGGHGIDPVPPKRSKTNLQSEEKN